MAEKLITDLPLIGAMSDSVNFGVDDGIQSYRATAAQLKTFLEAYLATRGLVPTGSIQAYGGADAPSGWLICDGSQVSRTTYAALFSAIGTNFGEGDGSTTFHLPDLRGRFLRGVADGSSNDPDRAGRTAMNTGGATGDNVGSIQGHAYQAHIHGVTTVVRRGAGGDLTPRGWDGGDVLISSSHTINSDSSGGSETRPANAYVNFMIKT